jgi:hypothetical protein
MSRRRHSVSSRKYGSYKRWLSACAYIYTNATLRRHCHYDTAHLLVVSLGVIVINLTASSVAKTMQRQLIG